MTDLLAPLASLASLASIDDCMQLEIDAGAHDPAVAHGHVAFDRAVPMQMKSA